MNFQRVMMKRLKEVYGIKPDEKVLIHVSNFRKVKRIDTILETFAKVRKTYLVN